MEQKKSQDRNKLNLETQNFSSFDELYKSIPKEGSLGLLALGARGLQLWRMRRKELEQLENDKEKK